MIKTNEEWMRELCPQFAKVMDQKPKDDRYSESIINLGLEPFEEMVNGSIIE